MRAPTPTRLLLLAGALGVFACDDTCPDEHVSIAILDPACGPTAAGAVPVPNGSFEARPDPLSGWHLSEAPGARVEPIAGLDGCTAIALLPGGDGFAPTARLATAVPALALRGQRVRVSVYARVELDDGKRAPALALRARTGNPLRVTEGARVGVTGGRWALHGVELDVPADADSLAIVMAPGDARRLELDGFTLERLGPACPGCEPPAPLRDVELDNLLAFTRLFGHVRYFHPSDWAMDAAWNDLALAGAQVALRADSPAALADALERAFQPRAPSLRVAVGAPPARALPRPPEATRVVVWDYEPSKRVRRDLDWLRGHVPPGIPLPDPEVPHRVDLGRGLVAELPLALYAGDTTFPLPTRPDLPLDKPRSSGPAAAIASPAWRRSPSSPRA